MPRRNRGPHLIWRKGVWYIREYVGGRPKLRSTGTRDSEEANQALADYVRREQRGSGPVGPEAFAIADALADYGEERAPKTADPERIGHAIAALLPFWKDRMVADVTEATCNAYRRHRPRSDGTVRRELGALQAAIGHAVKHGRLTRPVHVFMPPKPQGRDRWLTRTELAALLRAARRERQSRLHLPLFILIGLYTGARKQAILGLRWRQVDLERGRIDFNPPGRIQTDKRRPVIPIPRGLLWFLRKARERGGELGYVINHKGRPIGNIKRAFASAALNAGLQDVTPHTLRHTCGTWMAQQGVSLFAVARYLGHTTARTSELYAHHSPDFLEEARRALD